MHAEHLTRLRNDFARLTLMLLADGPSPAVPFVFPPPFTSMTAADWRRAVMFWTAHAAELLATVRPRSCPACGSNTSRFMFYSYDAHPFHECGPCGCWFVPKRVDPEVFERLFERVPEARSLAAHMMRARDRAELREADLARIGGYLDDLRPLLRTPPGRTPRYLDSGCGVGHSLRAARVRGFDALGVEVDTVAVDLARADGLSVTMPGDPLPPGAFDLVSFWETLEHIADPLGALREFVPHLADDGLVAITVPNMGSLQARIMRESCSWIHGGYNTPGHVNLFHVSALARLLERAGLTAIEYDGQFSGNPLELAAYLAAHSRGAFDALIDAAPRAAGLPSTVGSVLSAIWPGAALLERMALASPILRVVACRAGHERQFKGVIDERRSARHREIAAAAESMLAAEPDYKAMAAALQHEVNRRDDLLREQQQRFERSVEGRVRALARTLLGR